MTLSGQNTSTPQRWPFKKVPTNIRSHRVIVGAWCFPEAIITSPKWSQYNSPNTCHQQMLWRSLIKFSRLSRLWTVCDKCCRTGLISNRNSFQTMTWKIDTLWRDHHWTSSHLYRCSSCCTWRISIAMFVFTQGTHEYCEALNFKQWWFQTMPQNSEALKWINLLPTKWIYCKLSCSCFFSRGKNPISRHTLDLPPTPPQYASGKWRFSSGWPSLKMLCHPCHPGGDWNPGWGV